MSRFLFIVLCVISLIVFSYIIAQRFGPISHLPTEHQCIDTFDTFAFSYPDPKAPTQPIIFPQEPWLLVSAELANRVGLPATLELQGIRYFQDTNIIWAYDPQDLNEIYTFDTSAYKWDVVSATPIGEQQPVQNIVFPKNTSQPIWGINIEPSKITFYTFNENLERFVIHGSFQTDLNWGLRVSSAMQQKSNHFLIDQNDRMWLFAGSIGIFSFDMITSSITMWSELPLIDENAGVIYGENQFVAINQHSSGFYMFDLESGNLTSFAHSGLFDRRVRFIDTDNNFWLEDSIGWISETDQPHYFWPNPSYYWWQHTYNNSWQFHSPPEPFMQTSDGRLWFQINPALDLQPLRSGTAWYNPFTDEGCWFTSETSSIVESLEGDLWILIKGELYVSYR